MRKHKPTGEGKTEQYSQCSDKTCQQRNEKSQDASNNRAKFETTLYNPPTSPNTKALPFLGSEH